MEKSLMTKKEYGQVVLRLQAFMDERGINRNQLARAMGSAFPLADKWYKGNVERLDLDVLARICYVLDCRVEDILVYEKPKASEKQDQ